MKAEVELSVVIATRNRAASLSRLLEGLAAQVDAPPFEVVIGDNGSTDDTAGVIERAWTRLPIHCVREERPGKSRALNAALKIARGELIVFTDDDVQPYPDWLARLYSAASRFPDCNIFGGRILVDADSVPGWVRNSHNLMGLLASRHEKDDQDVYYGYGQYPLGPNMAIRRKLLAGIQTPYPEHMGPGTPRPVGDESRFFLPLTPPEAKDRLFVADACVWHEVEAENVAFWSALRRCFLAGRARGWFELPSMVLESGIAPSSLRLIASRIRTCRSVREFCCLAARYVGYMLGRHDFRTGCVPQAESKLQTTPSRSR